MNAPLPDFSLSRPQSADEAVAQRLAAPAGRYLAGGTDLIVNMRRGLVDADLLIDLSGIAELATLSADEAGLTIGAGVTLADLAANPVVLKDFAAIVQAAAAVAGPGHRAAATLGGNLCLDTRCLYYNQSEWWRRSNDFCLKYRGDVCHVAPTGDTCRAAFSGDLAPALLVHDAEVEVAGPEGRRRLPLAGLYRDDGAAHLALTPEELLVAIHLPAGPRRSAYEKIRVRGAVDFPLAGVAVAVTGAITNDDPTPRLKVAVTGTNSRPFLIEGLDDLDAGRLGEAELVLIDKAVQKQVSPVRTTMVAGHYRRLAAATLARRLAAGLAGA
jgi:4-hydroxybenzoyl-CoA reductase subunit beta